MWCGDKAPFKTGTGMYVWRSPGRDVGVDLTPVLVTGDSFFGWVKHKSKLQNNTSAFIMWGSRVRSASLQGCQQQHFTKHWLTPQATLN